MRSLSAAVFSSINACVITSLIFISVPAVAQLQWIGVVGPSGGEVQDIAMWDNRGVGLSAQNYTTDDDGKTWHFMLSQTYTSNSCITDTGGRAWMGTQGRYSYFTSDYGDTWNSDSVATVYFNVEKFVFVGTGHRLSLNAVKPYQNSQHVIFESKDPAYGTWNAKLSTGLPATYSYNDMVWNPRTNSVVLSTLNDYGTATILYRSTDFGNTWTAMALNGIPADEHPTWGFKSLVCTTGGTEFLSTWKPVGNSWSWQNYRSTDDGDTWTSCNTGLPPQYAMFSPAQNSAGTIFTTAFRQNSSDVNSTFSGIYRSTDDGITWSEVAGDGLPPQWAAQVSFTPQGTLLAYAYLGGGGGLFR